MKPSPLSSRALQNPSGYFHFVLATVSLILALPASDVAVGIVINLDVSLLYPAHALLMEDGALTVGRAKTFWCVDRFFFMKTAITRERKVKKTFPNVGNESSLRRLQTGC